MTTSEEPKKEGRSYIQKLWVPVVLLIGLAAGEAVSNAAEAEEPQGGFVFGNHFHPFPTDPAFGYHILFTTVEVALLIALVVVYGRMFIETKANFALGLVFVLFALLVEALLSNPVLEDVVATPPFGPSNLILAADILTICAYTVFLYLSLD